MTEDLEIHIIEIPKINRMLENGKLKKWILFLENPEGEETKRMAEKEKEIKEAIETLEDISSDEEKESALRCLSQSDSSIFVGNTISSFENKLAEYLRTKYSLALPNCTLSIYAALQTLGIQPDDEVIVPNLTHASSTYPILMSGAKLKVCEFLPNSYNYDIESIKKLITPKNKIFPSVLFVWNAFKCSRN